jgi:hypothetical protein
MCVRIISAATGARSAEGRAEHLVNRVDARGSAAGRRPLRHRHSRRVRLCRACSRPRGEWAHALKCCVVAHCSDPQPAQQVRNKQELLRQTFSFEHQGNMCSAGDRRQSTLRQSYQPPVGAEPQRVDRGRRQALYQSSISLGDL